MHTEYGQLSGSKGLKDLITKSLHESRPAHGFLFFHLNCKDILRFSVFASNSVVKNKTNVRVQVKANETEVPQGYLRFWNQSGFTLK